MLITTGSVSQSVSQAEQVSFQLSASNCGGPLYTRRTTEAAATAAAADTLQTEPNPS